MTKFKRFTLTFLIFFVSVLLFFSLLSYAYKKDNKYTNSSLQPIGGILYLTELALEKGPFFLTHEWQFFDNCLLTPKDFQNELPDTPIQLITIGKYNDFSFGNPEKSPYGAASYRLIIQLPETPSVYALELPEIYSSYNLYINDTLALTMGNIQTGEPETGKKTLFFSANGRTELLLAVKNNNHFYSGLTFPPAFGSAKQIQSYHNTIFFLRSLAIISLLLLCSFSLYFSIRMRNSDVFCYFCLCLFLMVQISYPVFYSFFSVKSSLWFGLELFTIYAIYLFIIRLQRTFLQKHTVGYEIFSCFLGIFCLLAFCYGIIPLPDTRLHLLFSNLTIFVKISILLYLAANLLYAAYHDISDILLISAITGILSVTLLTDRLLPFYEPVYGGFFMEYSGFLIAIAGAFYLCRNLTQAYRFQIIFAQENLILSRQVAMQKAHYQELTEKIAEAKQQRHDIRHHLKTIYSFLQDNSPDKAMDYLAAYDIYATGYEPLSFCENPIADALLHYYKNKCETDDIHFYAEFSLSQNTPIADTDLSIILGNLLENAYSACLTYEGSHPFIQIRGKQKDIGFVLIIENTFSDTVNTGNGKFFSSRHEGIGIESVKATVAKYNGILEIKPESCNFRVRLILQTDR